MAEQLVAEKIREIQRRLKVFMDNAETRPVQIFLADQNVLVNLELKISLWEDTVFVCRSENLGLSAFGPSPESAMSSFDTLIGRFAKAHYARGNLEDVLTRAGVTWTYKANDDIS